MVASEAAQEPFLLLGKAAQLQVPGDTALSLSLVLPLQPVPYKVLCPLQTWRKSLPCSGEQRLEQGNSRNAAPFSEGGGVLCSPLKRSQEDGLSLSCGVFRLGSSLPLRPQGGQQRGFAFIQLKKETKMHH